MKGHTQFPHIFRGSGVDVRLVHLNPPLLVREEIGGIFRWLGVEVGGVPVRHFELVLSRVVRILGCISMQSHGVSRHQSCLQPP